MKLFKSNSLQLGLIIGGILSLVFGNSFAHEIQDDSNTQDANSGFMSWLWPWSESSHSGSIKKHPHPIKNKTIENGSLETDQETNQETDQKDAQVHQEAEIITIESESTEDIQIEAEQVVLFSAAKGIVLRNGTPIKSIVKRKVEFDDVAIQQIFKTGEDGRFEFKAIPHQVNVFRLFEINPSIYQKIEIASNGSKPVLAWESRRNDFEVNSESHGASFNLNCDITQTPKNYGDYFGVCKLSSDENVNFKI